MPQNPKLLMPTYAQAGDVVVTPHNPDLVRVVADRPRLKGKRYNLVTPFAGKGFCFSRYLAGLRRLPLGQAHFVWLDNSNDAGFRRRLMAALDELADSWTLVEDRNPPRTVETTAQYAEICWRCHCVYQELYERRICDLPLCLNVEDDVELPDVAWERLTRVLADHPQVGTVVGSCASRRLRDDTACLPIAFNFVRREEIGGLARVSVVDQRLVQARELGVELIGAAHMGLWLTRTALIGKLGMPAEADGLRAQDLVWGYQLNRSGHRFAIDWSVKTRHYYQHRGRTLWV